MESNTNMATTYKMQCTCKHPFQDKIYGQQVRLATPCKGAPQGQQNIRCTVCLKQTQVKQ